MSEALNLEAAVGRCVLGVCTLSGRVVAGHFWCSYARASLTQTAPVRPRGCVQACACVCVCVRARSFRRGVGVVWWWCDRLAVWCGVG